jgi:hypothetical protein
MRLDRGRVSGLVPGQKLLAAVADDRAAVTPASLVRGSPMSLPLISCISAKEMLEW